MLIKIRSWDKIKYDRYNHISNWHSKFLLWPVCIERGEVETWAWMRRVYRRARLTQAVPLKNIYDIKYVKIDRWEYLLDDFELLKVAGENSRGIQDQN